MNTHAYDTIDRSMVRLIDGSFERSSYSSSVLLGIISRNVNSKYVAPFCIYALSAMYDHPWSISNVGVVFSCSFVEPVWSKAIWQESDNRCSPQHLSYPTWRCVELSLLGVKGRMLVKFHSFSVSLKLFWINDARYRAAGGLPQQ